MRKWDIAQLFGRLFGPGYRELFAGMGEVEKVEEEYVQKIEAELSPKEQKALLVLFGQKKGSLEKRRRYQFICDQLVKRLHTAIVHEALLASSKNRKTTIEQEVARTMGFPNVDS